MKTNANGIIQSGDFQRVLKAIQITNQRISIWEWRVKLYTEHQKLCQTSAAEQAAAERRISAENEVDAFKSILANLTPVLDSLRVEA